jgi:hypothetical protein
MLCDQVFSSSKFIDRSTPCGPSCTSTSSRLPLSFASLGVHRRHHAAPFSSSVCPVSAEPKQKAAQQRCRVRRKLKPKCKEECKFVTLLQLLLTKSGTNKLGHPIFESRIVQHVPDPLFTTPGTESVHSTNTDRCVDRMNDRRHGTKIGHRALRNALSCFAYSQPGAERPKIKRK